MVVVFFLGERISGANDLIGAQEFLLLGARASRPLQATKNEPPPKSESVKKWLGRHSALYNAIVSRFGPGLRGMLRRHDRARPPRPGKIEKGWVLLAEELRSFAALAEREKLPLLVVAMPEMGDLAQGGSQIGPALREASRIRRPAGARPLADSRPVSARSRSPTRATATSSPKATSSPPPPSPTSCLDHWVRGRPARIFDPRMRARRPRTR